MEIGRSALGLALSTLKNKNKKAGRLISGLSI